MPTEGYLHHYHGCCRNHLCAAMAAQSGKRDKRAREEAERVNRRAEQRAKEGRLQLAMINANCQLTVGVAMALKRGQCNGEVEAGLAAIEKQPRSTSSS